MLEPLNLFEHIGERRSMISSNASRRYLDAPCLMHERSDAATFSGMRMFKHGGDGSVLDVVEGAVVKPLAVRDQRVVVVDFEPWSRQPCRERGDNRVRTWRPTVGAEGLLTLFLD